MEQPRILLVDDSPETLEVLQRNLTAGGYEVLAVTGVSEALRLMDGRHVDLVITDLKMPRLSGLDLLKHIRENVRDTQALMITGYPSVSGAVEAMKAGAEEYLAKPFTEGELLAAVRQALDKLHARRCAHAGRPAAGAGRSGIIGASPVMREALRAIEKAAASSATVLITGESGTGKELVARAIHYGSARASAPFVPVNCAGIPQGLIESELFGHVKGAFTGATETRAGFFLAADGGTIFLDEVSEMSPSMQVRLLRVLEDKQVCLVGSNKPRRTDVRILAATNIDLASLVKGGAFRDDLFYRLNVIMIGVPPLRERGNDALLLVRHFADRFASELGKPLPHFSDEVLAAFTRHGWPGNVRELENVVQRLVVMAEGERIEMTDLPPAMRFSVAGANGPALDRTLAEVEAEYMANVLAAAGGNKARAAAILGIDRKTLREKLKTSRPPRATIQ